MTATDLAHVGDEEAADSGFGHWVAVRRGVLVLYFISLGVWSAHYGIPVQRELVVAWVCGALACASLGRPWREVLRLVRDWLPMMILLSAYDFTRGAADSLGIGVHVHPMIDFDRFLFFGTTPTQWLQAHVNDPKVVNWLDVAFTLIYTSYFIVPFTVAGFLWARDRLEFLRFSRRIVTLFAAGLATYIAFPAAPPWMAADMGLLHGVARTTSDGWQVIGGGTVELFDEGQASVNLVAAVPSLHSAFTMLVALFLWPRVRRPLRPLLLLYPLAMGLTLMATGEHYFFDVLLGWIYAGSVMGAWAWWERRRERVTVRGRSRPPRYRLPTTQFRDPEHRGTSGAILAEEPGLISRETVDQVGRSREPSRQRPERPCLTRKDAPASYLEAEASNCRGGRGRKEFEPRRAYPARRGHRRPG